MKSQVLPSEPPKGVRGAVTHLFCFMRPGLQPTIKVSGLIFRALLRQGTGLHGVRPVKGTIGGGDGHPRSPVELGGDGIEL